jgi:two-component system LytT family response regulator
MKVIIIDDDNAMHLIMRKLLAKISGLEIVGSFHDTNSASVFLVEQPHVHLAFVDISMPNESGMLFAKRMADTHPNLHIAFVTSHKDYAMDAFDILALDYIVKPVSLERLEKTVKRAMAIHHFSEVARVDNEVQQVCIYCLGGLEVRSHKGGSVKWISKKSAELFGYLLLHRGRMVSRVRLTADIFGGMPQKNAEIYLNTTIYQLRKSIEPYSSKMTVKSNKEGYSMDISDVIIDFVEFEDKLKAFAVIDASNLEQAVAAERLFGGDLFGEKSYLWALNDMERFSRMYMAFAKKLALALLKYNEGDSTAVKLLLKLLARNELDEEVVRLLLRAYTAQQDKTSLTKQYGQYVKVLYKELGIRRPSKEMVDLYSSLLNELGGNTK